MAVEYRAGNGRKGLSATFAAVPLNPVSGLTKSADTVMLTGWASIRHDRVDQCCFSCFCQPWMPLLVLDFISFGKKVLSRCQCVMPTPWRRPSGLVISALGQVPWHLRCRMPKSYHQFQHCANKDFLFFDAASTYHYRVPPQNTIFFTNYLSTEKNAKQTEIGGPVIKCR